MNDDLLLIQLRDCFTAGYTLPQFCIDNNIRRPLLVGVDENQITFLWELYVQFQYDIRVNATFALLNGKTEFQLSFAGVMIPQLHLWKISELNLADFDKIIVLKSEGVQGENVIRLKPLLDFCIKRAYLEIPLLHFAQQNPGVKVIHINRPSLECHRNLSENEKKLLAENRHIIYLLQELSDAQNQGKTISTPYDFLGYSNQKVFKLLTVPRMKRNPDGSDSFYDDEEIGLKDGRRITANQPEHYENKIYFVGNCVYYGYGVPYDKTVESHLQILLNESNLPYRVENYAQFICTKQQSVFYTLNTFKLKANDIVFVYLDDFPNGGSGIPFLDVRRALDRPHNYGETFPDGAGHINENGQKMLADKLFEFLTKNNFFKDVEFNYPNPPPVGSQIRHTNRKFSIPHDFFAKQRIGRVQEKTPRKKIFSRRDCHELQSVHART